MMKRFFGLALLFVAAGACKKSGADAHSHNGQDHVHKKPEQAAPPSPPPEPAAVGAFSGTITLKDAETAAVSPTDVLFIMARESQGGQPGRLMGVQRHVPAQFPMTYEMSSKNQMVPGVPFKGPFIVSARLDRDGDPMTKGDNDLYATFKGDVATAQKEVGLVLRKRAPSDKKNPTKPASPHGHGGAPHEHGGSPHGHGGSPHGASPHAKGAQP